MERIVLGFSGGLDTSIAIPWLAERYRAEVIAVTVDLGQGRELTDLRARALALGATRAHVLDARDEFAREYILPALQAGALYEDRYPLATALAGPYREETHRGCASRRSDGDRSWMRHAGQRSGPAGNRRPRPRPFDHRHCPRARMGHDPRAGDRIRPRTPYSGPIRSQSVQHRRQSLGPIDRAGRARGSLERAAG